MARIQTLRSSLLVLRARNSSGCARPRRDLDRAVEPPPTVLDPRQGALHLGRPSGVRLDDQARPGDDVTSLVERDRLASVRPWARQSEESSWYSPAVTGAGLQPRSPLGASASTSALSTPTWLRRVSGCAADRRADASSRSGRAKPRAEPRHQAVPSRHGPGQWPRTDYVRFPQCGLVIEGQGSKLHGHQRLGVRPIASRWGLRSRSPGCDSNASARVRAAATSDGS